MDIQYKQKMKLYCLLFGLLFLSNCIANELNPLMSLSNTAQSSGPVYVDPYDSPDPYKNYKLEREYNYKDIYATMIIIPIIKTNGKHLF